MCLPTLLSLTALLVGQQVASGSSGTEPEIAAPYAETLWKLNSIEHQSVELTDKRATLKLGELRDGQLTWRDKLKSTQVHLEYRFQRDVRKPNGSGGQEGWDACSVGLLSSR